ncbi:MAG: hypothetical protein QUV05_20410 [Phycisphaerae bacterium]|nr:hypothetical protein [Phycisphaerae bacterium]
MAKHAMSFSWGKPIDGRRLGVTNQMGFVSGSPCHNAAFQQIGIPSEGGEAVDLSLSRTKAAGSGKPENSAGSEHAMGFFECRYDIADVLNNVTGVYKIEVRFWEREPFGHP